MISQRFAFISRQVALAEEQGIEFDEILWKVLADYFQSNLDYSDEYWYSAAIVDAMELLQ